MKRQELRKRTKKALASYHACGLEAPRVLEEKGAEGFFSLMVDRDEAFHNFRALDTLLRKEGIDMAREPDIQKLWGEIETQNQRLHHLMDEAKRCLEEELGKMACGRRSVMAYHSSPGASNRHQDSRLVKRA